MVERIKEFFEQKGATGTIMAVAMTALLIFAIVWLCVSPKKPAAKSASSSSAPAAEKTKIPEAVEEEAVSNENVPAIPQSTDSIVIEETEADRAIDAISKYLVASGDYDGFSEDEEDWMIEDLSEYADQDPAFADLYIYKGYGYYTHDMDEHKKGDEVLFTCYVTKLTEGGTVVHYIARNGSVLTNDNFVTDRMMRIMNGDLEG